MKTTKGLEEREKVFCVFPFIIGSDIVHLDQHDFYNGKKGSSIKGLRSAWQKQSFHFTGLENE